MHTGRRARRGITLIELLVAIAIMILMISVLVPSLDGVFMLKQRSAAKELALTYAQLHDEAILRNKTFRIAYHLDEGFYEVEMGDPHMLVFSDAEAREDFVENLEELKADMTPDELKHWQEQNEFKKAEGEVGGHRKLPPNTRFGSVYTPQYKEPMLPTDADKKKKRSAVKGEEEGPRVVFSYIFSNGFAEYTVVQLVDTEDDEEGFTITVDPLSGKVDFYSDLIDRHDAFDNLPDEGPRLSN